MPTAYVTGGASGLGKATAEMLVKNGIKVFIADQNGAGAESVVKELNRSGDMAQSAQVDVRDWNQQAKVFGQAIHALGGRIDYVYSIAGINERRWIDNNPSAEGFEAPDLSVLDVDVTGLMYTAALAVQQFRRQDKDENGFRGKIACVASVCGFYCCPTLPIYTAAKHAIVGFVRSYGKWLPEEGITFNAVCPNVVRTNISTPAFYDKLEGMNLLTPLESVPDAFESLLGSNKDSGECLETGPNYKTQGVLKTKGPPFLDDQSAEVFDMLYARGKPLHLPK